MTARLIPAGRLPRPVTVDTGGPDDVWPGCLVTWMHTPRGGYGYSMPVAAKVLSHGRRPSTKVTIQVTTAKGAHVKRVVDVANLRWSGRC
jgi:hypothetical protein